MLAWRARHGREIPTRLDERRGIDPTARPGGRLLWLHAASVGESVSILPVLTALAERTDLRVLLTTGTVTSAAMLARRLHELRLDRVMHRFVPLDVPAWVARFLDHWRPDAAGFVESEIWPNLLAGCAARQIPVMLVNARMSVRSFSHWRLLPGRRSLFGGFAGVQAQSAGDDARLRALGAPAATIVENLKFAADPLPADATELARLGAMLAGRPVWLAASTHPGEDAAIRAVHDRLLADFSDVLTIVVPRHPERGVSIAAEAAPRRVARRSLGEDPPHGAGLWIVDTLGELGLVYRLIGQAFVGRSLGAAGGQNPLEPARLGCAVCVGPNVDNFSDAVAVLEAAGGLVRVADVAALASWVTAMLRDPDRRRAAGEAGQVASNRYADLPERVASMLDALVGR